MEFQYYGLGEISTEMFLEFKQQCDEQKAADMAQVLNLTMNHMRSSEATQIVNHISTVNLEPEPKQSELAQVVTQLSMVNLEESDSQHLPSSSDM